MITRLVLFGASRTLLWPFTRKSVLKQFMLLIGHKSPLQLPPVRISILSKTVCAVAYEDRFLVTEAMQASRVKGTVLLEPVACNTAFNVEGFTEKVSQDEAKVLLLSGGTLWSAATFMCCAQTMLSAQGQTAPSVVQACQQATSARLTRQEISGVRLHAALVF